MESRKDNKGVEITEGLPPAHGSRPRVLILGSFPSVLSLERQEYYGNPKNQFWRIAGDLFAFDAALPYSCRIDRLRAHHVTLWDVIRACRRGGSADSRIRDPVFNDIGTFLSENPTVALVALNGSTAGRYFRQACGDTDIRTATLPSTSPAHARIGFPEKREKWEIVRQATE
jgi:TDG/mug DNA glycosylase family protein